MKRAQLRSAVSDAGASPAAVECHPALQQRALRAYCAGVGVAVVAYSPLGAGALLQHPVVAAVAQQARRTPAQVLLRWGLQRELVVIPKARISMQHATLVSPAALTPLLRQSVDPARVASNADVWGFELDAAQLAQLDAIEATDGPRRFCWDPTGVA